MLAIMAFEAARSAFSFQGRYFFIDPFLPTCQGIVMIKTASLRLLLTSTLDVQSVVVAD